CQAEDGIRARNVTGFRRVLFRSIMKGKHIHKDVRAIIIPATQQIYKECIKEGYLDIFIDAGCVVSTPTCGPCLGGYMGILAEGRSEERREGKSVAGGGRRSCA